MTTVDVVDSYRYSNFVYHLLWGTNTIVFDCYDIVWPSNRFTRCSI